ncbi:cell envelope integrity protein TolA [Scytonema sp. NUACC26]|uniref:cell envelope integrity protein TolA n=1 Tax=Scytonema sp. NUACC26 TaxID=3140176 RepID=UPI0034DC9589
MTSKEANSDKKVENSSAEPETTIEQTQDPAPEKPTASKASEEEQKPTPEVEQKPTLEKKQKPTPEAAQKPTSEEKQKPTPEAAQKPTLEAAQKPTPEEKQKPTSEEEQKRTPEEEQKPTPEEPGAIFQAVGVITGKVKFGEANNNTITIGNKEYPLFYAPRKQKAFDALKKEVESSGESTQRVVVYPRFTHFPGRDVAPNVGFQLVGFDKGRHEEVISEELADMEFKLCGLWQFIPVCRTPCISVFKNFTKERLEHIKQSEPSKKVKYMKASHLPLFWRDALVPPFRFNPKASKEEQGKPVFVQIKARFVPHRDAFEFDSLLGLPLERPPKFLKASKDDKATAIAEKRAALKAAGKDTAPPKGKPPFKGKPKGKFPSKPQSSPEGSPDDTPQSKPQGSPQGSSEGKPKDLPKPKPKPKPQQTSDQ